MKVYQSLAIPAVQWSDAVCLKLHLSRAIAYHDCSFFSAFTPLLPSQIPVDLFAVALSLFYFLPVS